MPTYDYACQACGHAFEHFQPMGDKLLRKCPECGKLKLERLIGSGAGIVFRGTGFYETDYKRKAGKPESASPSSEGSKPKSTKGSSAKAKKPAKPDAGD